MSDGYVFPQALWLCRALDWAFVQLERGELADIQPEWNLHPYLGYAVFWPETEDKR